MTTSLAAIPVVDIRSGGPVRRAIDGGDRARALRDECVAWLPSLATKMLPTIDATTRRWLTRSSSPYVGEIATIATTLSYPGQGLPGFQPQPYVPLPEPPLPRGPRLTPVEELLTEPDPAGP